jgi:hypothetical protein
MKEEVRYVELKSGYADNGPAWIAKVQFSKSGKSIYFNNMLLKRGSGVSGNYYDVETGNEYWISGIKKKGSNRHWAGSGLVMIERSLVEWFIENHNLDISILEPIEDLPKTDIQAFNKLENSGELVEEE